MKNKIIILSLLLSFYGQTLLLGQHLNWYFRGVGATELNTDSVGNIYIFGRFTGSADFDPGPDEMIMTADSGVNYFIQKLTTDGHLLWARQIGGPNFNQNARMNLDKAGNSYLTGIFSGTADFDPGIGESLLTATADNVFLQKLDADGQLVWVKQFDFATYFTQPAIDQEGNILLSASFAGTADFDPGTGVYNLSTQGSNYQTIIIKIDSNGSFVWVKIFQGGTNFTFKITSDAYNNIYIAGKFDQTVDFDPGLGTYNLTSPPIQSSIMYIVKLAPNGDFNWASEIKPTVSYNYFYLSGFKVDRSGNVFCGGTFFGADFDPGPNQLIFSAAGAHDIFILKLDAYGNLDWAKQLGGSGLETSVNMSLDVEGSVYITGQLNNEIDLNPNADVFPSGTPLGLQDCFVLKLDSTAAFKWARRFGGKGADNGTAISVDDSNNVFLAGNFEKTADFGENPGDAFLVPLSTKNCFVLKLDQGTIYDGFVYWDLNANQLREPGEPVLPNVLLTLSSNSLYASTNALGHYTIYSDIQGDTLMPIPSYPYWSVSPVFSTPDSTQSRTDFAVSFAPNISNVSITATQVSAFRPGFNTEIVITIANNGATLLDSIPIQIDSFQLITAMEFISATPSPNIQISGKLLWYTGLLAPGDKTVITCKLKTPVGTLLNTMIDFPISAYWANDIDSTDNRVRMKSNVMASLDPNDKQVLPTVVPFQQLEETTLSYVVRFQNMGNVAADFVIIRDTLADMVNIESLKVLGASHPFTWSLHGKGILEVRFDSIQLPPSSSDLDASQGFIAFSIRPNNQLLVGDLVINQASIYFDYNPAIITNAAISEITLKSQVLDALKSTDFEFKISPNPVASSTSFWVKMPENIVALQVRVVDMNGNVVQRNNIGDGIQVQGAPIQLNGLLPGAYVVMVDSSNGIGAKLLIVE